MLLVEVTVFSINDSVNDRYGFCHEKSSPYGRATNSIDHFTVVQDAAVILYHTHSISHGERV